MGDLTTMTLIPQICDAVSIPARCRRRHCRRARRRRPFMLGASGVRWARAFLVATECTIHHNYKQEGADARDIDTGTAGKRLGHPVRAENQFMQEFIRREYDPSISNEELEKYGSGALRLAAREGDVVHGAVMVGQSAAMVHKEQPAREIVEEIMAEAEVLAREGAAMGVAFVFDGQGAQWPGMGKALSEASVAAKAVFDMADSIRPGTSARSALRGQGRAGLIRPIPSPACIP